MLFWTDIIGCVSSVDTNFHLVEGFSITSYEFQQSSIYMYMSIIRIFLRVRIRNVSQAQRIRRIDIIRNREY